MVLTARSLRVDADRAALAEVRRFVRSAATDAGAPAECLHDIVQAVDEAATNAIVHGYEGRPGWLDWVIDEQRATREAVALYDRKGATFFAERTRRLIDEWSG